MLDRTVLRREAERCFRYVARSRGAGLYYVRGRTASTDLFDEKDGLLYPTRAALPVLAQCLAETPCDLSFARFANRIPAQEDIDCLSLAIKCLEEPGAQDKVLDKRIRSRAAVLLREHNTCEGGGLDLCRRIVLANETGL